MTLNILSIGTVPCEQWNWMRSNFQANLINYMRIQKEKECSGYNCRWKQKKIFVFITAMIIPMSHWHQQMVDGAEHLISCDWLVFLSAFSHLQLIQNSVPFTIFWRQCDIWITNDEFKCQNRVNFQMKFLVKKSLWKKEACPPNGLVSEKKVEQENHHFIIICACVTQSLLSKRPCKIYSSSCNL